MICGVDLIQTKGYVASNLGRWSIYGRWRMAPACPTAAWEGTRWRHCQGGWLARARWPGCSGAPNTTGKKAEQRGDHGGAHLGQQMARWAAVVAHGGGAAPSSSGDGGGSMRGSSGSMKMMGSFMATSSSSSQLQLRRGALNWWHTAVARVWFLWLKLQGK
jgi:hypothetical protein